MVTEAAETKFKFVFAAVAELLKTAGFKKSGVKFRREAEGNLELIEFQRSVFNDRDCIRFTANIGVISGKVLRALDAAADIQKQSVWTAHLNQRLGHFSDEPNDYWWELSTSTNEAMIAQEISNLIAKRVLPFLGEHASDEGLAKLWQSGRSPGLTEFQRKRNLAALN